jgi:hypothetical protein
MKKIAIILFAIIFLATPLLSFGQEETPANEKKNLSYAFINEYGGFLGGTFGFTGVFINGIAIKKQDIIGLGVGYEVDTESGQSLPFFVNYRHYFPGKRALKPLVNFAVGARICFWDEYIGYPVYYEYNGYMYEEWYGEFRSRVDPGFYATMAAGFKVKAFSFTSGFFMKSCAKHFYGGVEVKVGFTF